MAAVTLIGRAFELAKSTNTDQSLITAGRNALPALQFARLDSRVGPDASLLLDQIAKFEEKIITVRRKLRTTLAQVSTADPRIVINTLGTMQIIIGKEFITAADWKSERQRDVFFYLLQNPRGATKTGLQALFWSDTDNFGFQFQNTLYKIRRFLGGEIIEHKDGRYFFNRRLDYESDVELFWESIELAKRALNTETRTEYYEKAFMLYKGDYLPEVDGIWVIPERERLRQSYLNSVIQIGEHYLEAGKSQKCLDFCWAALDKAPDHEDIYRLAMRAAAVVGNRASVEHYYQLCKKALRFYLQIEPSLQTVDLYLKLVRT